MTNDQGNRLLAALGPADREVMLAHIEACTYDKGHVLHEQGEHVRHVFFPYTGLISLVSVMSNGATAEANSVGPEGVAGALSALSRRPAMTRSICQLASVFGRMDAGRFRTLVNERPQVREAVDRYADCLLSQAQQFGACNLVHQLEARLARWILSCHDRVEGDEVSLTQEFLGEMLGVRRTTVTEVAQALQDRGLIRYRRGHIQILDKERLEGTACECRHILQHELNTLWEAPLAPDRGT